VRPLAAVLLTAQVVVCASGCGGLALRRDDRLHFISPPDHARVTAPLLLRWRMRDFRPVRFDGSRDPGRGEFAVFVDSAPMRPGHHLDSLAAGDPVCRTTPGCPDRLWLRQHGVYLTTRSRLALPALPIAGGRIAGLLRRHEITIVLLDGRGFRIGESAWTLTLYAASGRP
jgi:hypothetical protein